MFDALACLACLVAPPAAPRSRQHEFATAADVQTLEDRVLLTVFIDSNTTWNSDMTLNDTVVIRNGATLTIANGVTVDTTGAIFDIRVGEITGTSGRLVASNVNFDINVKFRNSTATTISNDFFGNTILGSLTVAAEQLSELKNNDYEAGSRVFVGGEITSDTTWENFGDPDLPEFEVDSIVTIKDGATLTIQDGVTVNATGAIFDIRVGEITGTSGRLVASNVNFDINVKFRNSTATTINNDFFGNTILGSLTIDAERLSQLKPNDYESTARIFVSGVVDSDTTWENFGDPDLMEFEIEGNVIVRDGATLTIQNGVVIGNLGATFDILVGQNGSDGFLHATGVDFDVDIHFDETQPAAIAQNFNGNILQRDVHVHAHNVSQVRNNDYTLTARLFTEGTITNSTTWIINDPDLEGIIVEDDVDVTAGATLTIRKGINLVEQSVFNDLIVTDGALVAYGVGFDLDVVLHENSSGVIRGGDFFRQTITQNPTRRPN